MSLFNRKNKNKPSQKNISGALQNEKQKSDIIVNAIDDAVILIDAQGIIQAFNPAAAHITGWKKEEACGIDYKLVVRLIGDHDTELSGALHPFYVVCNNKTVFRSNELSIIHRDNSRIGVDASVTPIVDSDNNVSGAVAVLRNIEEQRRQDKQRADFISTASHEMRTPVAAIEGYLSLALNKDVATIDDKARGYLEKAHASTSHLGQLFQDLLTSAKAEDGRLTSNPVYLEINEFIEKLTEDLKFSAEKKNLQVNLINEGVAGPATLAPLFYVYADPERIREVITNIFDNAVKYTDSGKITIGISGNQTTVYVSIADTGAGIPQADIPHLFQKFYRVDNSATRTIGGTGLGLFISQKIIELYNGKITVESEEGKGSKFYVQLPRIDPLVIQQQAALNAHNTQAMQAPNSN